MNLVAGSDGIDESRHQLDFLGLFADFHLLQVPNRNQSQQFPLQNNEQVAAMKPLHLLDTASVALARPCRNQLTSHYFGNQSSARVLPLGHDTLH